MRSVDATDVRRYIDTRTAAIDVQRDHEGARGGVADGGRRGGDRRRARRRRSPLHEQLPVAVEIVALGVLGAWYNSLQHEVIHGHPTPWRARQHGRSPSCRSASSCRSAVYRALHLAHHRDARPHRSRHRPGELLRDAARRGRAPGRSAAGTCARRARSPGGWCSARRSSPRAGGGRRAQRAHAAPGLRVAATSPPSPPCSLVVRATGMSVWTYVVGVVWAGGALSLLRSFAEHRHDRRRHRARRSCAAAGSSRCFTSTTTSTTPTTCGRACRGSSCPPPTPSSAPTSWSPPAPGSTPATARSPAATCCDRSTRLSIRPQQWRCGLRARRQPPTSYRLTRDGETISLADYRPLDDGRTLVFHHTLTKPEHRGNGYAAHLVRRALDDVRAGGHKRRGRLAGSSTSSSAPHPEYADLAEA